MPPFDVNEPIYDKAREPTPFERVLSPNNSGGSAMDNFSSFVGRFYGVPSSEERQAAAEADVMRRLSGHLETTGGDPQKAILDFMKTPQGLELMSKPNMVGILEKWKQAIVPPNPQQYTVAPGHRGVGYSQGKQVFDISQPTAETQTFNSLIGRLSNATPEMLDTLAQNAMSPHEHQARGVHLQRLVDRKELSPEEASKFAAGVYKIVEGKDDLGTPNGTYILYDGIKGTYKQIGGSGFQGDGSVGGGATTTPSRAIPSNDPEMPPHLLPHGARNPDGTINPAYLTEKKYMGLGVGPAAKALSLGGVLLRSINPSNPEQSSRLASMRQQQIDQLDTAITALGTAGNGRLKTQLDVWRKNVPSQWTDPLDAYDKLGLLHDNLSALKASELVSYRNSATPRDVRLEARKNIELLNNALASMPTRPEIEQMKKDIVAAPPGAMPGTQPVSPASAGKSMIDMGKNAVGAAKQGVTDMMKPEPKQPMQPAPRAAQPQEQPTQVFNLDANPGTQPAVVAPQQPVQGVPSPVEIMKMDENALRQLTRMLPPGPSQEREAIINRARQLMEETKKAAKPKGE